MSVSLPSLTQPTEKERFLAEQRKATAARLAARKRQEAGRARDAGIIAATSTKNPAPWSLDALLESEEGRSGLHDFCASEMSEESLEMLLEIRRWRLAWATSSPSGRRDGAARLVQEFLAPGAPKEVCVPTGAGGLGKLDVEQPTPGGGR